MTRYNSIMLLAATIFLFSAGCGKPQAPTTRQPESASITKDKESQKQLKKEEMESLLNELKFKNPFSPKHFKDQMLETKKEIKLEGIMWDNQKPFAVIDGSVLAEGDFIDGKKVIRIDNESVILDNQGKEEILKIQLKWE